MSSPLRIREDATDSGILEQGLVDEKKLAVQAKIKYTPDGKTGRCLMCLNGRNMFVYAIDEQQNLGPRLYKFMLLRVARLKTSSFVLNRYMKFRFERKDYKFVRLENAKAFNAAVAAEVD